MPTTTTTTTTATPKIVYVFREVTRPVTTEPTTTPVTTTTQNPNLRSFRMVSSQSVLYIRSPGYPDQIDPDIDRKWVLTAAKCETHFD